MIQKNVGELFILLIVINLGFLSFRVDFSDANMVTVHATSPHDRTMHAMVFDSVAQKTLLFGGSWDTLSSGFQHLADTWAYDYTENLWTDLAPTTYPSARDAHAMVFDSTANQTILFGGGPIDTWSFNFPSNTWTQISTGTAPPSLYNLAMVYDSVNQKVILFGGLNNQINDAFWAYDPVTSIWTELNSSIKPAARYGHSMMYDSVNQKILLFGGNSAEGYRGDTWEYDYPTNTWNELTPASSPSPRYMHSMIYDSSSEKGVLFGGFGGSLLNETWLYDYDTNSWEILSTNISPSPRTCPGFTYDSLNHKGILFGGYQALESSVITLGDLWIYHPLNTSWSLQTSHVSSTTSNTSTIGVESTAFLPLTEFLFIFIAIGFFRVYLRRKGKF